MKKKSDNLKKFWHILLKIQKKSRNGNIRKNLKNCKVKKNYCKKIGTIQKNKIWQKNIQQNFNILNCEKKFQTFTKK